MVYLDDSIFKSSCLNAARYYFLNNKDLPSPAKLHVLQWLRNMLPHVMIYLQYLPPLPTYAAVSIFVVH